MLAAMIFTVRFLLLCRKVERSWSDPVPEDKEARPAFYAARNLLERTRTRAALIVIIGWAVMAYRLIPGSGSTQKLAIYLIGCIPFATTYFRCLVHNDRSMERSIRSRF